MTKKKTKGTVSKVAEAAKQAAVRAAEVTAKAAKATSGVVHEYVVEPVEKALGFTKSPKPKAPKSASAVRSASKELTKTVARTMPKPGSKKPAKMGPGPSIVRRNQNDARAPQVKRSK